MPNFRQAKTAAFIILVAAFVAIRIFRLTDSCLWFDEIFSVHAAEHSWNTLLSFVALDLVHPPLFYALLKLWIGIGGESLIWLRTFPAIFSILAIVPFLAFQRELKLNTQTQLISLFFLTISGHLLKYSLEVRMYSLLLCLALTSLWLFVRYLNRDVGFTPLVLINIFLIYTQYFGWFVILSEIAVVLFLQRTKWRKAFLMFAIALVSFVPWMVAVVKAAKQSEGLAQNIGRTPRPGLVAIVQFGLNLIEPFYSPDTTADPLSVYRVTLPLILILIVSAALYFVRWGRRNEQERRTTVVLLILAWVPPAMAFAASWLLPQSVWGTRHLIYVLAPVSILFAITIVNIPSVKLKTAILTLLLLFSGYAFAINAMREKPVNIWCTWGMFANELAHPTNPRTEPEHLFVFEDLVAYHFWFELRESRACDVTVVRGIDGLREDKGFFLPRGFSEVPTADISQIAGDRIWIAFRQSASAEGFEGPASPVPALQGLGFEPNYIHKIDAGNESAYLILMVK